MIQRRVGKNQSSCSTTEQEKENLPLPPSVDSITGHDYTPKNATFIGLMDDKESRKRKVEEQHSSLQGSKHRKKDARPTSISQQNDKIARDQFISLLKKFFRFIHVSTPVDGLLEKEGIPRQRSLLIVLNEMKDLSSGRPSEDVSSEDFRRNKPQLIVCSDSEESMKYIFKVMKSTYRQKREAHDTVEHSRVLEVKEEHHSSVVESKFKKANKKHSRKVSRPTKLTHQTDPRATDDKNALIEAFQKFIRRVTPDYSNDNKLNGVPRCRAMLVIHNEVKDGTKCGRPKESPPYNMVRREPKPELYVSSDDSRSVHIICDKMKKAYKKNSPQHDAVDHIKLFGTNQNTASNWIDERVNEKSRFSGGTVSLEQTLNEILGIA